MKKLRDNQKYNIKPKKTKQTFGKTKINNCFKGFRPTLEYGFVFFCFVGFPEGFYKTKKTFEKIKHTKENHRTQKENIRENKNNKVVQGFRPTLGYVFFFVCWFSRRFLQNQKKLRENQKYQRKPQKNKKQVWKTTTNNLNRFQTHPWIWVWLFCVVGFPEGFYKANKTFEKTNNTKDNQRTPKNNIRKNQKTKFFKVSDPPLNMGLFVFVFVGFPEGFYKTKKPSIKPNIQTKTNEKHKKKT